MAVSKIVEGKSFGKIVMMVRLRTIITIFPKLDEHSLSEFPKIASVNSAIVDSAIVDEYLFGSNFTGNVNTAQTMEKVANKMAKKS